MSSSTWEQLSLITSQRVIISREMHWFKRRNTFWDLDTYEIFIPMTMARNIKLVINLEGSTASQIKLALKMLILLREYIIFDNLIRLPIQSENMMCLWI